MCTMTKKKRGRVKADGTGNGVGVKCPKTQLFP